ncbi:MAG: DUF983 domain-containing protein [Hyphomicrobiaceae bacterium]
MIEEQAHPDQSAPEPRDTQLALLRGARQKCPACGKGALFYAYLKVNDACPSCGEELHHHRADDAPPYFTMLITGHIVVGLMLSAAMYRDWPNWVHMALWPTMVIVMSLWLLPRVKGALVALQWALRMHGFSGQPDEIEIAPGSNLPRG